MDYKKVYVLFERHTRNGERYFKTIAKGYVDLAVSDEWYKVNEIRNKRFQELKKCAIDTGNFKETDFCDENYSILHKDGFLVELIIVTKYFA